jgi:hypothetical protein
MLVLVMVMVNGNHSCHGQQGRETDVFERVHGQFLLWMKWNDRERQFSPGTFFIGIAKTEAYKIPSWSQNTFATILVTKRMCVHKLCTSYYPESFTVHHRFYFCLSAKFQQHWEQKLPAVFHRKPSLCLM